MSPKIRVMKKKKIKAAGGVVFRADATQRPNLYVLLIFRNGYWDLPKGVKEKGESLSECARREVSEEVGSSLPVIMSRLGDSYHEYIEKEKLMAKTTAWYTMYLEEDEELTPQEKEGIEKVEWIELGEAKRRVGFENLEKVLDDFDDWYENQENKKGMNG